MNPNLIQTQNSHAMLLALAYLGDGLRKNDIAVVRLANILWEYNTIFVLHAANLGITHVHV